MGRRRSTAMTDAELALMETLWRLGPATVGEVLGSLPEPKPSYNSVQTRLNILEDKGYAKRSTSGRAHRYRAAIARDRVLASAVSRLISRFFPGSSALALSLVKSESFSEEELSQLELAIAQKRGTS
jgi:BlaI family penicillinase repressor